MTSANASETLTLAANYNPVVQAVIGGTKTTGDVITLTVYDSALSGGKQAVLYTVTAGDTFQSIAIGLSNAVNANSSLQNIAVSAVAAGTTATITSNSVNATSYIQSYSSGATESVLLTTPTFGWQVIPIGGTKTTGNVLTITTYNALLTGGKESVSYTVLATDTLDTIAAGLAAAINVNSNLAAIGVSATATSSVVNMQSVAPTLSTYAYSRSAGSTETLSVTAGYGLQSSIYNGVNELTDITRGGAAYFKGTTSKPIKSASISTEVINIQSPVSSSVSISASSSKTPTETLSIVEAPGTINNAQAYNFNFGGTATPGDTISVTFSDVRLIPQGSRTVSYTVQPADNIDNVAYAFSQVMDTDAVVQSLGIHSRNYYGGPQVPVGVPQTFSGPDLNPPASVGITYSLSSLGSETVQVSAAIDENKSITVGGTVTTGDVVSITVNGSQLSGGSETISYTVPNGSTTTSIATALTSAVNADSNLQSAGISAYSTGSTFTVANYTYFTTSVGSGTETLTISKPDRGSALVTVGGAVTAGDVLSITAHNANLLGGQSTVSYTVQNIDTLVLIAQNLTNAINASTDFKSVAITVQNRANTSTHSANGYTNLPPGTSTSSVSTVDGSNNIKTNNYAISVNNDGNSNITYDLNGNMTSDGLISYSWDAENRITLVTYPGVGNSTSFTYDALSQSFSRTETVLGAQTTVRFVWASLQKCEERDLAGSLTKVFENQGVRIGFDAYYYSKDHLSSIREICNASVNTVAELHYNPWGELKISVALIPVDRSFAGYEHITRCGLEQTYTRLYEPHYGRFLSRDLLQEEAGPNTYSYCHNRPVTAKDPLGLQAITMSDLMPVLQQFYCTLFPQLCNQKCLNGPPSRPGIPMIFIPPVEIGQPWFDPPFTSPPMMMPPGRVPDLLRIVAPQGSDPPPVNPSNAAPGVFNQNYPPHKGPGPNYVPFDKTEPFNRNPFRYNAPWGGGGGPRLEA